MGTNIDIIQIDILGFSNDLNLIGDIMEIVEQNTNTLVEGAKSVGLQARSQTIFIGWVNFFGPKYIKKRALL